MLIVATGEGSHGTRMGPAVRGMVHDTRTARPTPVTASTSPTQRDAGMITLGGHDE